jgi:membrane-bound lytic murein transglycosylase A
MNCTRNFFRLILVMMCLAGCMRALPRASEPPAALTLVETDAADLADDLNYELLDLAIERSLRYYDGPGRNDIYRIADRIISANSMKESLNTCREIITRNSSSQEKKKQIKLKFNFYRATGDDGSGTVLFTGYYEPMLFGSLTQTERYRYPLYRPPPDIVFQTKNEARIGGEKNCESGPYYTRREIDVDGVLQGKNLELVWVDDPVELFTLHIQGSGKIKLEDDTMLTVGYAQNNGRPFSSVTRFMLDNGKINRRESSYRNFKKFLRGKSEKELFDILSVNERYIFFRFVDGDPVGSLGEPVTADRSIATDPDYFPQGALALIRLSKPVFDVDGNIQGRIAFSRFVLNQDKGSAIKGPGRVDLFCGFGTNAQFTASSLKEKGELYFLIKK